MNVENRKKGHSYDNHVFLGMSLAVICFISLFAGIGVASATITGTPPTPSGDTNIYTDTTWSDEVITLSGNVVIHPGGSLTLDSTTLIVASTSSASYGLTVKKGSPVGGRLKIINGSNVTAENPVYNTWIYAEYEYPPSSKSPVIQASDSYFSELGKGFAGGPSPARYGLELRHTTSESYFDNITVKNSVYGICLGDGGEPINITNSTFEDIDSTVFDIKYVGAYIYNNTATNFEVGVYTYQTDGLQIIGNTFDAEWHLGNYVIDIMASDKNFVINDNVIKNFQRGIVLNGGMHDGLIENNTMLHSNGGGIAMNNDVSNITVKNNHFDNVQNPIIFNVNYAQNFINWTIEENTIVNPGGTGMVLSALSDSIIRNNTITNTNQSNTYGIRFVRSLKDATGNNVTISNTTISGFKYGLQLEDVHNSTFIDISINNSNVYDIVFLGDNPNNKFINTLYDTSKTHFDNENNVFCPYFYLDVETRDLDGNPIDDAVVNIGNTVDDIYPPLLIKMENATFSITDAYGYTSLPTENESAFIAILDYRQTNTEKTDMCYNITSEKDGNSNSATVNPDSFWYTSDPDTYQNIVTIVLETGSDTTQPTITNISAKGITSSSATITWTTDEPATSQMEYGLTTSYGSSTILDTNLVTLHSQTLTGLTPSTAYHYRVKSNDTSNNLAISADYTFLTTEEAEGLVGYWNFDECSEDTAYDSSGNDNHGTLVNGPQRVDGKIGGALSFDGTDDYVNCGNAASLNTDSVTVEAVLKFDSLPAWNTHFLGKAGRWVFNYRDGKIKMLIWNGPSATSTTVPSLDTWYHVVGTYDGSIVKIYVNGVEENNRSGSASGGTGYNFTIGFVEVQGDYFNGTIDEVHVYNRVLSADEILAHYQAGLGDNTNTLSGAVTSPDSTTGIADANVTLTAKNGTEIETVQADSTGHYEFTAVLPGDYNINATKRGYWPDSNPVTVNASEPATADIVLCQKGDFNTNSESADAGDLAMMADATAAGTSDETYDLDGDGNPADEADLTLLKNVSVGVAELE